MSAIPVPARCSWALRATLRGSREYEPPVTGSRTSQISDSVGNSWNGSSIAVAGSGKILILEFLFTFALAFVMLNVATAEDTENNSFFGLAIGFTLAVGAFAIGSVSGGALNPAIALGASVLGAFAWSNIWVYLIAGFAGGAAAAAVFRLTEPVAEQEQPVRSRPAEGDTGLQAA